MTIKELKRLVKQLRNANILINGKPLTLEVKYDSDKGWLINLKTNEIEK